MLLLIALTLKGAIAISPTPPPPFPPYVPPPSYGGSGISYKRKEPVKVIAKLPEVKKPVIDDDEIFLIIKTFLKCQ